MSRSNNSNVRALVLTLLGIGFSGQVPAQHPETCKPAGGATNECTDLLVEPYIYSNVTCAIPTRTESYSEAFAIWFAQNSAGLAGCPGHTLEDRGWPGESAPMCAGGGGACTPGLEVISIPCSGDGIDVPWIEGSGLERANTRVYDIGGYYPPPSCTVRREPSANGVVGRKRETYCPRGYTRAGGYCIRSPTSLDPAKNNGAPCPSCGNPINPGSGNKYQEEVDYSSGGAFPLEFRRHYNSQLRTGDVAKGYFNFTTYRSRFEDISYARLAHQEEISAHFQNMALDSVGQNWRHTYQRAITFEPRTSGQVATAFAYRHDGKVYAFTLYEGSFHAPDDVADRLEQISGGGFRYTSAARDEVETYSDTGKLLSIVKRGGYAQVVSYDGYSRISSVTDSFGRTIAFLYATAAPVAGDSYMVSGVRTPDGQIISFGYDERNRLMSVLYPDASSRGYLYENESFPRALTGLIDESGIRFAAWAYDAQGRASLSEHAGGVDRYTLNYPGSADTTTGSVVIVDPAGVSRTHVFQNKVGVARRANITQPKSIGSGTVQSTNTLDVNGNVTRSKDFNGSSACYVYDMSRNLETVRVEGFASTISTCPASLATYTPTAGTRERKVVTAWHSAFRRPTSITEANRTTSFTYDGNANLLTRTVTDTSASPNVSRTSTYTYNSYGQVLAEDGPRTDVSDVTNYSYYTCTAGARCGQLSTIMNALGHVTTYDSYNTHGQPTQITDANGLVTSLAYDLRQRLTDRCVGGTLPGCPGGELTHLDYWPTGLLKKVTNPDASYVEYTYDAAHRLTQINDGAQNKIVYTLDSAGNRTAESTFDPGNALRRTHTRLFNTLNQLWKDVNAAGTAAVTTTFGYDNNGNQTTVNAPLSRNSTSLYDELNRLKQITDPALGITRFGYDANDNLTSITDPRNLVTSYTYSGLGDLKTQTSPDTGFTTNTYDSGGNLDTSTDSRGVITRYAYDAANRVTSASFTLGGATDQTITYTYDTSANQNGRLTSASDANHTLAWTYDAQGRVTGKGQTVGATTLAMGYGFNSVGKLGNMQLPSGANVVFGYNANGQVTSLTLNGSTLLSGIIYDPFGPITSWTWGNGTTANRAFDTDGKITQVDNAAGMSLKNYAYDDAFRITGITDAVDASQSWTYGYDLLDRLSSASKAGIAQGWTYDANGNRLTQTGSMPSTYTNASTSNRVSSISGSLPRVYGYDSAGNTLSYAGATFTYNNRGRMVTASSAGVTASYVYNAMGQRVSRAASGATTLYVYDEAGHLIGEYTGAGALMQETVWLGDIPVATLRADGSGGVIVNYVHADHLNTPRIVTDTSNNLRWRWDSDPFGSTQPNENPSGLGQFNYNLRFPGQQYDAVVGLHYNYYRDYDPAIGKYVQSDPIGLKGGINTYAYVGGNPLSYSDPRGLAPPRSQPGIGFPPLFPPGPFDDDWNRARDNAGLAIEDWINRAVSAIQEWCMSDEQKRCKKAKEECITECMPQLGKPGTAYTDCIAKCMDRKGCSQYNPKWKT